jgi:WD40 repeat protein/serine/threonine protein kinase
MTETPCDGIAAVTPAMAERIDRVCDAFELDWQKGRRPRPEDYLADATGVERTALLGELIRVELHYRRAAGEEPKAAEFLARMPEARPNWLVDLLGVRVGSDSGRLTGEFSGAAPSPGAAAPACGDRVRVPGFEVLGEVGRGGMGVVYKARHVALNRLVALKLVPAGAGAARLARFRAEAAAAARLQHPHIVQVHDFGVWDGRPYLALEFVDGGSLAQRLEAGAPAPEESARLVETLARAMQYAHERGVVHRDLKPANILLRRKFEPRNPKSERKGNPEIRNPDFEGSQKSGIPNPKSGAPAVLDLGPSGLKFPSDFGFRISDFDPKITDFGLAKVLADDGACPTVTGDVLGTPSYMAPEQAAGRPQEVGPAADVYGLGAVLYQLLTGRPPFRAETPLETLDLVRSQEPVAPHRLAPLVPPPLEAICLRCLEKDPARRYTSAGALADDLQRFLAGNPTEARRAGRFRRVWSQERRRRAVWLAGFGGAALAAVAILALFLWPAPPPATEAPTYFDLIARASEEIEAHRFDHAQALLAGCKPGDRAWEWHYLDRQSAMGGAPILEHGRAATGVAYSPDGRLLASAGRDHQLRIWDRFEDREIPFAGSRHPDWVEGVTFSPDGLYLASWCRDGKVRGWLCAEPAMPPLTLAGHSSRVVAVAFRPDGRLAASAEYDGGIQVWEVEGGRPVSAFAGHGGRVTGIAFSPDGQLVASASYDETVRIWDPLTASPVATIKVPDRVTAVAFHPGGTQLAAGSMDGMIRLWSTDRFELTREIKGHLKAVTGLAFQAAGDRLASGSEDQTVRLWDVPTGREVRLLRGHREMVTAVAFAPDGRHLASASADGAVHEWDVEAIADRLAWPGHEEPVRAVAFSSDSRRVASASKDKSVKVWDVSRPGQPALVFGGHTGTVDGVAFSPDGTMLASASQDGKVFVWHASSGQPAAVFAEPGLEYTCVVFHPAGQLLAAGFVDGKRKAGVRVWDLKSHQVARTLGDFAKLLRQIAYSPNGEWLAAGSFDGSVRVWEAASGRLAFDPGARGDRVSGIAFSPDGGLLACTAFDGKLGLWDWALGQGTQWQAGDAVLTSVAFSPDGRRLATASQDHTVRLWDVATGRPVLTLAGHAAGVNTVAWSPDGRLLASADGEGTIRLWSGPD